MPSVQTPELFLHKPSKAQLKKAKVKGSAPLPSPPPNPPRPPPSMDSSSSSSSSSSTPPVSNPKKPFLRRIFPLLLVVNFAVGAYIFMRTTKKQSTEKDEEATGEVLSAPVESTNAAVSAPSPIQPISVPERVLPPVPEDEQRELFKWILEEKRKVKPGDSSEKKKIDEEKALLKQYIRAKSIPTL